jgi:hypothetical protein
MATPQRPAHKNRILYDSANAKWRFGYEPAHGYKLGDNAPKNSDLWFLEYTTVTNDAKNDLSNVSVLAKSVSPISIQTSSMPVDQYGKRVYIPTRVDFPEVALTMYDDISGKMFDFVEHIYSKFFMNNDAGAQISGANAESVLTEVGRHGRKIPDGKHNYYHQHFEKITIYHFFGNLEQTVDSDFVMIAGKRFPTSHNKGQGTLQKIELINPLVTSIQFSGSDYSTTELRTVDLSLQPENIIMGKPDEVHFPAWMTWGMSYMMDTLAPLDNKRRFETYPATGDPEQYLFDNNLSPEDLKKQQARKEEQDSKDTQRKLQELSKLYNAGLKTVGDMDEFYMFQSEEGNEAMRTALANRIGVINAAQANKWTKQPQKTFVDDFNKRGESTFESTYLNPDVPSFGEIGSSNPPINKYTPYEASIDDSMVQELVGAAFGRRDFNLNNIVGNAITGNLKDTMRGIANNALANNALFSTANSAINSIANGLKIDGSSLTESPTRPIKRPLMTGTTEKAFRDFPLEENVNLINTGNHSGISKVIKTWNGSGPE